MLYTRQNSAHLFPIYILFIRRGNAHVFEERYPHATSMWKMHITFWKTISNGMLMINIKREGLEKEATFLSKQYTYDIICGLLQLRLF